MKNEEQPLFIAGNNCFTDGANQVAFSSLDERMLRPFIQAWPHKTVVLTLGTSSDRRRDSMVSRSATVRVVASGPWAMGWRRAVLTPLMVLRFARILEAESGVAYGRLPSAMGFALLVGALIAGRPAYCSLHGLPKSRGRVLNAIIRACNGIILRRCVTVFATNPELTSRYGARRRSPVAVRTTLLERVPEWRPQAQANGIRLVFGGRLVEEKNPRMVLEVMRLLNNRGFECRLDVVGSGIQEAMLRRIAEDYRLNVTWHGWVDDHPRVLRLIAQGHFVVIPSASEGNPKVMIEAMAQSRIPIIYSHNSAVTSLAAGALIMDSFDTEQWADAISSTMPEEAYNAVTRRGRDLVSNFTMSSFEDTVRREFNRTLEP